MRKIYFLFQMVDPPADRYVHFYQKRLSVNILSIQTQIHGMLKWADSGDFQCASVAFLNKTPKLGQKHDVTYFP